MREPPDLGVEWEKNPSVPPKVLLNDAGEVS